MSHNFTTGYVCPKCNGYSANKQEHKNHCWSIKKVRVRKEKEHMEWSRKMDIYNKRLEKYKIRLAKELGL